MVCITRLRWGKHCNKKRRHQLLDFSAVNALWHFSFVLFFVRKHSRMNGPRHS